jgi:hypothetical protein
MTDICGTQYVMTGCSQKVSEFDMEHLVKIETHGTLYCFGELSMFYYGGGIVQGGTNIIFLKLRIPAKNIYPAFTMGQMLNDHCDRDARSIYHGLTGAYAWVEFNAI